MHISQDGKRLVIAQGNSRVWIEPWGRNSLRVRMTAERTMDAHDWALTEKVEETQSSITFRTIDVTDPWYRSEEYAKYHQTGTEAELVLSLIHI